MPHRPKSSLLRILIAEDDPSLRRVLGTVLESAGHQIAYAENGEEALRALEREPIDLVVTDMIMPLKDGLEFIGEAHKKRPLLPIVAISGGGGYAADRPYYLNVATLFGAATGVPKPFTPHEILAAIDRAWAATIPQPDPPPRAVS